MTNKGIFIGCFLFVVGIGLITFIQFEHNERIMTGFCEIKGYEGGVESDFFVGIKYFNCLKVTGEGVIVRSELYDLNFVKDYMKILEISKQ